MLSSDIYYFTNVCKHFCRYFGKKKSKISDLFFIIKYKRNRDKL